MTAEQWSGWLFLALVVAAVVLLAWWLHSQESKHGKYDVNDDNDMGHW